MELLQARSVSHIPTQEIGRSIPAVFWIVLTALALRLLFLFWVPPLTPTLEGDDGYYLVTGRHVEGYFRNGGSLFKELLMGNLFRGNGVLEKYGLTIPWGALRRGPVYPFFLGGLFWILGPNPFGAFLAQAFLVSVAAGLLYGIGKALGEPGGGLAAASTLAIYPPTILVTGQLLQESLAIFLFTLFYFLFFRLKKSSSMSLFVVTGFCLFLLSFSRSTLVFFPCFIALGLAAYALGKGRPAFRIPELAALALSFLTPYLLWTAFVSWQFHRPALIGQPVDREMFSALLPDYEGWTPDAFMSDRTDTGLAKLLEEKGLSKPGYGMMAAALQLSLRQPWSSFKMAVDKFRRLWWQPFDWPWRGFVFGLDSLQGFHRFLVLMSVAGGVLWWFEKRFAVGLLGLAPLYGTLLHSFFHIEGRYGLIYLPFLILFAGVPIHRICRSRAILFGPGGSGVAVFGFLVVMAVIYKRSDPGFLLTLLPVLEIEQAHLLSVLLQSLALAACFTAVGFCLRRVFPRRQLLTGLFVTAFLFFLPFEVFSFTSLDWREWQTPLENPAQAIRQEIFLPRGSLEGATAQNLRLDIALAKGEAGWFIKVNGEIIGDVQGLREAAPSFPFEGYRVSLQLERKMPFEMRQWYSLPLHSGILKEGDFNQIEMGPFSASSSLSGESGRLLIYGDYPSVPPLTYEGPLFQRSPAETSIFKYQFDGDFRLNGRTPLESREVKSDFYDGQRWRSDDLSPERGIQRGQYRIRIEIEKPDKKFFLY